MLFNPLDFFKPKTIISKGAEVIDVTDVTELLKDILFSSLKDITKEKVRRAMEQKKLEEKLTKLRDLYDSGELTKVQYEKLKMIATEAYAKG